MLNKILYSYFSLAALTALVQKIVNLLSAKIADNQMVAALLARLQPQLETALQAIGSSRKQPLTEIIRQADMRRDNSFMSLRNHVRAGLRRENESYRTACEALWIEFEKNGLRLDKFSREKQTAAVNSLLNDLGKPENQNHLKTTHATKWAEELDNNNKTYVTTTQERSALRSSDDTVKDETAFKDLKISLDLLDNMLNAMYAMNTPEGIASVIEEISQYISEANTSAKISKSNRSNGDEDEDAPTPEVD